MTEQKKKREGAFHYSLYGVEGRKLFCCFVLGWNSYLLHSWSTMPFVWHLKREVEKTKHVFLSAYEVYFCMLLTASMLMMC